MSTPLFRHDCRACEFLGPWLVVGHPPADLYWCARGATVIARFGDDGPDYTSGLAFVGVSEELTEAFRRAYGRGLIEVRAASWGEEEEQA